MLRQHTGRLPGAQQRPRGPFYGTCGCWLRGGQATGHWAAKAGSAALRMTMGGGLQEGGGGQVQKVHAVHSIRASHLA